MNQYLKEVIDAHDLIQSWLGDIHSHNSICEDLLSRFSPLYTMVTPNGGFLDFKTLNTFFRSQHGARTGLNIEIKDMAVIAEHQYGATVIYKELQQQPGQDQTLRFSTLVFEKAQDKKIIWRHLHETFLPIT
ncbi:DUF4440 domain-containing protein [Acinetobacter sp. MD2(2019)]|uniref:DUF4440 domain-containing protein n=1 Tax=Acinetobacter sp. MD2(2019) TaxID=2605273 RepID=UPI002D1E76E6|nr:DUF4440 domain-containing protein [Acinetobacter sp. MD2(2019)]MEB3754228.1 DUF4440 domain-containing protein [Acinetobacter sp. MD2(2019)]